MKVTTRYKLPVSREISARGVKYSKVNKMNNNMKVVN